MKKILIDTNFLIDIIRFKVGLEEIDKLVNKPYKILILNRVVEELNSIENKNAKAALKLMKLKKIKIIHVKEKNTDNALVALANKNTIVATNDKKLRKRLKIIKVKIIYLRKRKHLAIS